MRVYAFTNRFSSSTLSTVLLQRLIAEVTEGSATFSIPLDVTNIRGRTARMDTEHNVEGREIASLVSVGRVAPTRAESDRSLALLRVLQGSLPLFDNHWVKALWLPDTVIWPESFTTSG